MGTISLAGSAPGEKLVAIYTCCRYGPDWAQWREINTWTPKDGNEATLNLGLDANRKITSVTGISNNEYGFTQMLQAQVSDGSTWGPHGPSQLNASRSERPSPSSPQLLLSHLSGDATNQARIIRFHWRPQWGGGSALLWFCNNISSRSSKRFQMIFINFYISREVIAPFNGKPSVLICQEVFENRKVRNLIVNVQVWFDCELQMWLDCKESQNKCFILAQYSDQLMLVEAVKK